MFTDKHCSATFLESSKSLKDMLKTVPDRPGFSLEQFDLKRLSDLETKKSKSPARDKPKLKIESRLNEEEDESINDILSKTKNRIANYNDSKRLKENDYPKTRAISFITPKEIPATKLTTKNSGLADNYEYGYLVKANKTAESVQIVPYKYCSTNCFQEIKKKHSSPPKPIYYSDIYYPNNFLSTSTKLEDMIVKKPTK